MTDTLNKIRKVPNDRKNPIADIAVIAVLAALGAAFGFFAKYFDEGVRTTQFVYLYNALSSIGSDFTFWIFTTSLIAAFSRSPLKAGINSFVYLVSMVAVYYIETRKYGYIFNRQMIMWLIISIAVLPLGALFWYSRGKGKFASFMVSAAVSICLAEMYYYLFELIGRIIDVIISGIIVDLLPFAFCAASAALLVFLLRPKADRKRTALIGLALSPLIFGLKALFFMLY